MQCINERTLFLPALALLFLLLTAAPSAEATVRGTEATSGDTLRITLAQAETRFLEENLMLVAERTQLDISDAQIRQARLWPNPEISIEHQIINRDGDGPIGFTSSDNTVFEIEQTIFTAGKRSREIRLRELERMEAGHAFDLVLKSFRRDLRETFYELVYLNRVATLYDAQLDGLERLVAAFDEQRDQGNVSRLEAIRLRSLLAELQSEYNEVLEDRILASQTLQTLLQLPGVVLVPDMPGKTPSDLQYQTELNATDLGELALRSRSDLGMLQSALDISRQSLRVEQSRAWPDLGVGVVYDKLDGPVDHYIGLMLSLEVPLFNRNQGNIQSARHAIRRSETLRDLREQEVRLEVAAALERLERATSLMLRLGDRYDDDFSEIMEGLMRNYRAGELRLVEFIDYYESFREGLIRSYAFEKNWLQAVEALNFAVGTDIAGFPSDDQ